MKDIVRLLTEKVSSVRLDGMNPGVCISGGIDSTVILHHVIHDLMEDRGYEVYTFTVTFGNDLDERNKAQRVADHYGTVHTEILITKDELLSMLPDIMRHYPFPRFNVWTWPVIKEVVTNTPHLFIGEGGDELFGYPDRSYLEGWAGQLVYVWPAWSVPCECFGVNLHAPFKEIQDGPAIKDGMPYYDPIIDFLRPPDKELLREAYKGILPDFVIGQGSTPPSHGFYKMMGMSKKELQIKVSEAWLEVHSGAYKRLQPEMRDVSQEIH